MSSKLRFCITTDPDSAWRPVLPHDQLPALPQTRELQTCAVRKACIEACAALAELKQAAELIPNQAMLINTLPLLEAKDSSEIETTVTTTDQLLQYAQSPARQRRQQLLPTHGRCRPPLCLVERSPCQYGVVDSALEPL